MTKAKVLHPVEHDGVRYEAGQTFEADAEVVETLIEAGALRDPKAAATEEETAASEAEAKAAAIIERAEKQLDDAKTQAEKIVSDAKSEADKVAETAKTDADKVLADAKTQAEKIVSDAKKIQSSK